MKKLLILSVCLLAITKQSYAQCEQPTQLPYFENMDAATVPFLPECMSSSGNSFVSGEIFKTISGPIEGFQGNVIAYDTTVNTEFGMPASTAVNASFSTPLMYMQQGMAYTVYFLYANSDPNLTITSVTVRLNATSVAIGSIQNITGAEATNFISAQFTPPSDGNYSISVYVDSEGTQGLFYLDTITVQEVGVMGIGENTIDGVSIYPNPAKDRVSINYKNEIELVELYGSTGQLVLVEKPNALEANLNVSGLSSGVYFLNITSGGLTKRSKLLKE